MKRGLAGLGILAVLVGLVWVFGYRDTTTPPRFEAGDFAGMDMPTALQTLADAMVDGGAPGVVLYTWQDGQTYQAAAGTKNKATGEPMPMDDPLRVASISKLYTAAIVHGLIAEDRLGLDQKVSEILPAEIMVGLHNGPDITVRHLLLHRSGIPDYYDIRHYLFSDWKNTPLTLERTLPVSKRGKAIGPSGGQFEYSNMGYILLGRIAETVSGETYNELLDRLVLTPLGQMRTSYDVKHPVADSIHGYGT